MASGSANPTPGGVKRKGAACSGPGELVGVHPQLEEVVRERIATRLAVPTLKLIEGARSWDGTWKRRGEAIQAVLAGLPQESSLLDRLLEAGALAGLWGPPHRWEARRRRWVQRHEPGSRGSEQHGEGGFRSRAPPPTKMSHPPGP